MSIESGRVLAHYRLVEKIGSGGMGEVWRAADTTLGRDVAVKILPDEFAADQDRLARFDREARLLAGLNHPGIAVLHGLHEAGGVRFLAMELVEGEDLSAVLARGAVAPQEARGIALQISAALEAAHEQGVIHRDLKPANVRITHEGKIKLLDFGLAKAMAGESSSGSSPSSSMSPTLTAAGTAAGVILGTAAYMSPEQARGKPIDRRADIWAFGVILYEMLAGRRLFEEETVTDTLAAVLRADLDLSALPPSTPGALRRLLARCLERDPRRRLRDIGEARIVLESPVVEEEEPPRADARPSSPSRMRTAIGAAVLMAIAGVVGWQAKPAPEIPVRRLSLAPPAGIAGPRLNPAISPTGKSIAYIAGGKLWIQDLDRLTAREVTGGEGATNLTWSPDGTAIAFAARNSLWRVAMGGDPALIAQLQVGIPSTAGGLGWTARNNLVYCTGDDNLFEIPVTGGTPRVLLEPEPGVDSDFHEATTLPDGRGVLYVVHKSRGSTDTIEVLSEGRREVVFREEGASIARPVYSPTGHILFERGDVNSGIWSIPFSLQDLEPTGDPVLITAGGGWPTVSADGSLLYSSKSGLGHHQLTTIDREGNPQEKIGDPLLHADNSVLSPDGRKLAVCVGEGKENNLWIFDLDRAAASRLAYQVGCGGARGGLAWSPDGEWVVYKDAKTDTLRKRRADGASEETTVAEGLQPGFSHDGRYLVFSKESPETKGDLWYLRLDGEPSPQALVSTPADETFPQVSPGGDLLAYVTDESGRSEVFVRPFPTGTGRWPVSSSGGTHPRWSANGDRLYYLQEWSLMEVELTRVPALGLSTARQVFTGQKNRLELGHGYDVLPEDRGFVAVQVEESSSGAGDLTLVTGWNGGP